MADRCCDEHGCTRKQPILLLPSGLIPGRWYVVTRWTCEERIGQPARVESRQKHALDEKTAAMLTRWREAFERRYSDEEIALTWHDATCPEAQDCQNRQGHSRKQTLVNSGVMHRFLARLGVAVEEPSDG